MKTELKELKAKEKIYTLFTAILGALSALFFFIWIIAIAYYENLVTLFVVLDVLCVTGFVVYLVLVTKIEKRIKELQPKESANNNNQNRAKTAKFPFTIHGARGRSIEIFENKCIITTDVTLGSIITKNATDGSKTIYYSDVVGVQFKEAIATLGYLQLETAGMIMNNSKSNFFNENTFTFDNIATPYGSMNEYMRKIADYVQKRVEYYKTSNNTQTVQVNKLSSADELRKYKALLDDGIITQEEFETKKKELLNS